MKLSIVVLTCNQKDFTLSMLASLKDSLTGFPDRELIIIDNGSTDGSREAIMSLPNFPTERLKYIWNSTNRGVAAGRNIGLRAAKGDYILILDNDTEVTETAINSLIHHLDSHPQCGLCAAALYSPQGYRQDSAKDFPGLGVKIKNLIRKNSAQPKQPANQSGVIHPFYVIGACQLFRRELIDSIGLLDEHIFYGPEDADWCQRIRKAGFTIDYLPEVSIIHHWQRASNRLPFSRLAFRHVKSLLYFYVKHRRLF